MGSVLTFDTGHARTGIGQLPQDLAKFFSGGCDVARCSLADTPRPAARPAIVGLDPFTCEFRPRAYPIFSKAAAMSAVRFLRGRQPHLPSPLRARQIPG